MEVSLTHTRDAAAVERASLGALNGGPAGAPCPKPFENEDLAARTGSAVTVIRLDLAFSPEHEPKDQPL